MRACETGRVRSKRAWAALGPVRRWRSADGEMTKGRVSGVDFDFGGLEGLASDWGCDVYSFRGELRGGWTSFRGTFLVGLAGLPCKSGSTLILLLLPRGSRNCETAKVGLRIV